MQILLLGKTSSITNTIHMMLRSVDGGSTKLHSNLDDFEIMNEERSKFDLLIANLEDFRRTATIAVSQIRSHFPDTPLLAVHSYLNRNLIKPLLNAGATGYIQNNISDSKLIKAVQKVASGTECVIA